MEALLTIPVLDSDDLTLVRVKQSFDFASSKDEFSVWIQGRFDNGTGIADCYRFWKTTGEKWDYEQQEHKLKSHLGASSVILPATTFRHRQLLFRRLLQFLQVPPSALARPFDSPKSPT